MEVFFYFAIMIAVFTVVVMTIHLITCKLGRFSGLATVSILGALAFFTVKLLLEYQF